LEKVRGRIRENAVPLGKHVRAGRPRRDASGDEGLSLVEVIVALSVLLIAFLAVALLLQTNFEIIASTSDKQVAGSIATGIVNQQRQNAANQNAAGYFGGVSFNTTAATAASWCNGTSCNAITQKEQGTTYYVYVAGGWCFENSSGTWGDDTTTPTQVYGPNGSSPYPAYPAYFVAVKVAWGPTAKQTTSTGVSNINPLNQVVLQSIVAPSGGYGSYAPTTGPINSCPAGTLQ
jgi:Tfp pilus assembly protein PilV